MDKNRTYLPVLLLAALAAMSFAGCSSSTVTDTGEISADELPVVDAATDQLPDQMDQPMDDATVAEAPASGAEPTADALAPEAPVDVPLADAPPAEMPASSPSFDAPPSMNEVAAPTEAVAEATPPPAPSAPVSSGGGELYEVQGGDTLMKIAFKVYGDVYQWRRILDANSDRISDPARLVSGTQLKVDNAPDESYYNGYERYLIKSGDTLGVISTDVYGTKQKWKQLWKMNDGLVKDPNRIYAGFFLRYTMTEQDRQESEQLKSSAPAPLAEAPAEEPAERNPSSVAPANTAAKTELAPATVKQ
jgi:nucleoid-associated protein YgaU